MDGGVGRGGGGHGPILPGQAASRDTGRRLSAYPEAMAAPDHPRLEPTAAPAEFRRAVTQLQAARFRPDDVLLLGSEGAGVPAAVVPVVAGVPGPRASFVG